MVADSFRREFISEILGNIGADFAHHYSPDFCDSGTNTVDACMNRGLGPDEFDCSGLIIAGICQTLEMDSRDWPAGLRHARQLNEEAITGAPRTPGDILIAAWRPPMSPGENLPKTYYHTGVLLAGDRICHAVPHLGVISEQLPRHYQEKNRISLSTLAKLAQSGSKN